MTSLHEPRLSQDEKRRLYRDGFIIVRQAISADMTRAVKQLINENPDNKGYANNRDPRTVGLYNDSILPDILEEAMGPHTRPITGFVALTAPGSSDAVVRAEFDPAKIPHPEAHVDGGWAGLCPVKRSEILASGQDLHTWGSDGDPKSMGPAGGAPLWQDPDRTLAIGSFTAFVGVCLNDQSTPGKGQFAVRRGAHEAVEAFFRMQRRKGGPIGGGGPGWPRLVASGEDNAYAGKMPEAMVRTYPDNRFEMKGWPWPELTPALMQEGDAVIALHALPHTATPNLSDDPRINVYFRIRRHRPDNPHEGNRRVGWGVSDHPDRALNGDFLEYPDSYDPYKTSIDKLCHHWSEWDGMQQIIEKENIELSEQHSVMADYW
jgi:hypothetical protein